MNKQWIAAMMTLFLLAVFCPALFAYAEEHPEPPSVQTVPIEQTETEEQLLTPSSETEGMPEAELIKISYVKLKDKNNCFFLVVDESPTTLPLPDTVLTLGRPDCFEVSWRLKSLDNHTPGRQELIGDVILPEGYVFAWDPLTVSVFVIVYEPGKPPIVEADDVVYSINLSIGPITVPVGTSREELQQYFEYATETAYIYFDFDDSEYSVAYECPLFLNLDVIDTNTPGIYYPFTYELPAPVSLNPQGMHTTKVYVLPDDAVRLIGVANAPGGYIIKWLYPAQNPVFWLSVDDGEWSVIETDANGVFKNKYGSMVKDDHEIGVIAFFLETRRNIPPGHVYRFQVQYDNDRFSDVLIMDLTNTKKVIISNGKGGDRDGGDRGEAELPAPPTSKGTSGKKNKVTVNEDKATFVPAITPTPILNETSALPSPQDSITIPTVAVPPDGEIEAGQLRDRPSIPEVVSGDPEQQEKAATTPSNKVTASSLPATTLLPATEPLPETKQVTAPPVADSSFAASSEGVDLSPDTTPFTLMPFVGVICLTVAATSYVSWRKRR